ncbi:MAG: PAS domain S-box protein [Gemmataceae bacterium]
MSHHSPQDPRGEAARLPAELADRPARPADHAAENHALAALATALAQDPDAVLPQLAERALALCRADSAGVSVADGETVRWQAVAGALGPLRGRTVPRAASPWGTALERAGPLLVTDPAARFATVADLRPAVTELLLVPFRHAGRPAGVVWVAAHGDRRFDTEDARLLAALGAFAAAALAARALRESEERSQRAAAEAAAQRSDDRFRTTADHAPVLIWVADVAARGVWFNRPWLAFTGRTLDQERGDGWAEGIHRDDFARCRQVYHSSFRTRQPFTMEYRLRRHDGEYRWVLDTGQPQYGSSGEFVGFIGSCVDITDRKAAEAEHGRLLREVQAERGRLEEVFRLAPSFLCVLRGPDHVFERTNDRYRELIDGREVIGRPVREALPEVEGQGFFEVLDRVYRTGEPFVGTDLRILLRRGGRLEERVLEFVYQPMRDAAGQVTGVLAHGVDLTDRKHAETELARVTAESERRRRLYETILASIADFVYVFSLDHHILYANPALVAMWGVADPVGKTFLEIGYEPWHAAMHEREIDQVRQTRRPIRGEVPFTGTGGRRIYDYIFVPVFGADGEVEAVAGTTRDVTERKAMEDVLREADRKKDEFIALLAHELRNPLAPIRNGLQVLRLAGPGPETDRTREMMDRQLTHLVRLVDDLLDVSRISRNKMELRRSRVALADVVASAVETASPPIEAAGHRLTVTLPPAPVYLNADLTRLAQVFSNLLTNSAKYTPPGGRIDLTAELHDGQVAVAVRDTGIGVPPAALPTLFDMFSQVDRSIERTTGGLGIGLALVKGLVDMHGGTVSAHSDGDGRGSTFTVTLPVSGADAPSQGAADEGERTTDRPRRVLVVDDNRDGADSLALMLRLLGHDPRTAHDGIEAIELAEVFRPDVILMDVGMPRLNGLDATRRIRERPWGRAVTIVAADRLGAGRRSRAVAGGQL